MFEFNRNQVIVTVLVFMIVIAAVLQLRGGNPYVTPQVIQDDSSALIEVTETNNFNEESDFFNSYFSGAIETLAPDVEDEMQVGQMNNIDVVITKKDPNAQAEEVMGVTVDSTDEYFVQEKMLRDQSRASQIEELTQYVADDTLDANTKAKAAETLIVIQDRIEKESGAESLLRAKGFKEVFVRMSEESVDVVVNEESLTDEQVAQIEEIVQRKTGYSVAQIRIHIKA